MHSFPIGFPCPKIDSNPCTHLHSLARLKTLERAEISVAIKPLFEQRIAAASSSTIVDYSLPIEINRVLNYEKPCQSAMEEEKNILVGFFFHRSKNKKQCSAGNSNVLVAFVESFDW